MVSTKRKDTDQYGLQPLPEAHLVAASMRQMAKKLLLEAERLEASCPLPARKTNTEFLFSRKRRSNA